MVKTVKSNDGGAPMGYHVEKVPGNSKGTPRISGSDRRKFGRALRGETARRSHRSWMPAPTALAIIESLPTKEKPTAVSVFGQLGKGETATLPTHRLSPAMGRRLRRRGRNVVQAAVAILQEENARLAAKERAKTAVQEKAGKVRCSARTKVGLQCRNASVADGYCAKHGG